MTLSRLFNRTFQRALALGLALTLGPGPGLVLAASPDADAAKAVATHGIPKGSNRDSTHSATQGTKHSSNKNRSTSRSVLEGAILKQQRSKFTDVHSIGGLANLPEVSFLVLLLWLVWEGAGKASLDALLRRR